MQNTTLHIKTFKQLTVDELYELLGLSILTILFCKSSFNAQKMRIDSIQKENVLISIIRPIICFVISLLVIGIYILQQK